MKKNVNVLAFCSSALIIIVSSFSCWSPFQPVTHIGRDVVSAIDSSVTDMKRGFKVLNSIRLAVNGARSVVNPGADTSIFWLKSGDFAGLYEAGRFGDDSATMYAEFQMSISDLAKYKTGCNSSVDSIRFMLWYDTANNNKTASARTITVFLCSRKFFPYTRNELIPVGDFFPCTTLTLAPSRPDSFFISLGPEMVSKLNRAIADSVVNSPYPEKIDTLYGNYRVVINSITHTPDSLFGPDTVTRVIYELSRTDTIFHVDSVFNFKSTRDSAGLLASFSVKPGDSTKPVFIKTDTLLQSDTAVGFNYTISPDTDTVFVTYSAFRRNLISAKFDTLSSIHDSSKKFIGAVSVHASGGGIVRFSRNPVFQVINKTNCTDSVFNRNPYKSAYYDVCMNEVNSIPSDSLMTSWQANRFIEMPISLKPLWDSVNTKEGQSFRIVQAASCSLYTANSLFDSISPGDTIRTIVYGLLDHTITDAEFHSLGTYDSLNRILSTGRVAVDTVHRGSSGLCLTMTPFLQSLADESPRPSTAYLYLFARPVVPFTRVVFNKVTAIKFSALFSNPHE